MTVRLIAIPVPHVKRVVFLRKGWSRMKKQRLFFAVQADACSESYRDAVEDILQFLGCAVSDSAVSLVLEQTAENKLEVLHTNGGVKIRYAKPCQLFRGIGLAVEQLRAGTCEDVTEIPAHDLLAPMIDCSRNAVVLPEKVKELIRYIAVMGYDSLMLYTEDVYEVEGYPYFGYMRGRYTADELRDIDRYALRFGIEVIPCIQTLGHLNTALRWASFGEMRDTEHILLADEPKTYDFIEAIIKTLSSIFTSRRIHIGMDESAQLGTGQHMQKHGYEPALDIMQRHLEKVTTLCRQYGLSPIMWSDMFFYTAEDGSHRYYYDLEPPISPKAYEMVPEDTTIVYWDYYHGTSEDYQKRIEMHQKFPCSMMFAGGAWKWVGFAPGNLFSYRLSAEAIDACLKTGVRQVLVTAWGDGGNECSTFAILPILQLYAEGFYAQKTDKEWVSQRLEATTGVSLEDFLLLDLPNAMEGYEGLMPNNYAKYMLYQDVLFGFYDKHVTPDYREAYRAHAERLQKVAVNNPMLQMRFDTLAALCSVLEFKAVAGIELKAAYDNNNRERLQEYADTVLPEIKARLEVFRERMERQWLDENKAFGYEVTDIRIGGLQARLDFAIRQLKWYLDGSLDRIEELEQERLFIDCRTDQDWPQLSLGFYQWSQIVTGGLM